MESPAVLVIHNQYQHRGGEDTVFETETALLESKGHRVDRLVFDNATELKGLSSPLAKLRTAAETVWSKRARQQVEEAVMRFKPDVVHFHNTFPLVSPGGFSAARQTGAAVVQTLHNYRLVCPAATFYRDGNICEDCIGRFNVPGVLHGCYRNSRSETAVIAAMLGFHSLRRTWNKDVDLFVAPSAFLRDKIASSGIESSRVFVKPNFLAPDPGMGETHGSHALFVGRVTETKGVKTLLRAYEENPDLPELHIVGDGDLAPDVAAASSRDKRIKYRGPQTHEAVLDEMGKAGALVFPSVWYEVMSVTMVEALARGLPIIASRLGGTPEIVEDGRTGLLFEAGNHLDLASQLSRLTKEPQLFDTMGTAARASYESNYGEERAYELLREAYDCAIRRRQQQ